MRCVMWCFIGVLALCVAGCGGRADYREVVVQSSQSAQQVVVHPVADAAATQDAPRRGHDEGLSISASAEAAQAIQVRLDDVEVRAPMGSDISITASTVEQPSNPDEAATIHASGGTVSTGAAHQPDQLLQEMSLFYWFSGFFVLAGISLLIFSKWIPYGRRSDAVYCFVAAGAFAAVPSILDSPAFKWSIGLLSIGGAAMAIYWGLRKFDIIQAGER